MLSLMYKLCICKDFMYQTYPHSFITPFGLHFGWAKRPFIGMRMEMHSNSCVWMCKGLLGKVSLKLLFILKKGFLRGNLTITLINN